MRIKIYPPVILGAILALITLGFSQTARIVRWEVSDANSKRFFRKDAVVKQALVDGVDGITVTAAIKDRPDSFSVELEVNNHGKQNLELRPQDIQLQVVRPGSKTLSSIPPDVLAKRVIESENLKAARVEAAGSTVLKTVVEADRKQILNTALAAARLTRYSRIEGRVYYDREKNAQEVLLRIPLGDLTVEIPFTAVRKDAFLAPTIIKFE